MSLQNKPHVVVNNEESKLFSALVERINQLESLARLSIYENILEEVDTDIGNVLCSFVSSLGDIKALTEQIQSVRTGNKT